jgi:amidase
MAILLNTIAGADPADPLTLEVRKAHPLALTPAAGAAKGATHDYQDFTQFLKKGALKGARLGVLRDFFGGDPEIDALANAAISTMRDLGATLVDVRLDPAFLDFHARNAGPNIRRKADYRFKKDFEDYLATFGPDVPKTVAAFIEIYETKVAKSALPVEDSVLDLLKRGIATSTDDPVYQHLLTTVLPEATKAKLAIFTTHNVDALVFPYQASFAAPISNPTGKIDDPSYVRAGGRPNAATLAGYGSVGFPGIVVPMGFGAQGLPMAISFMGRPYDEGRIIGYAFDYEQASRKRRPSPLLPSLPGEVIPPAKRSGG